MVNTKKRLAAFFRPSLPKFLGGIPLVWLGIFFLLPILIVFRISFSDAIIGSPPYTPILSFSDGKISFAPSWGNYQFIFEDTLYVKAYFSSIIIAACSSIFCLLLGYPMAYVIARSPNSLRIPLLLMVLLPFWTSFLIRVYAWIAILNSNGYINQAAMGLGLIDEPWLIRGTYFSVFVGMTYSYLPLMILPLYVNFVRLPTSLLESAADLGCRPWQTFLHVILPLSRPGIMAGVLLVFIPAIGEFIIPSLLGSSEILMIGRVMWDEFFSNRDWPLASAVTIALLTVVVLPLIWLRNKIQEPS